MSLSATSRASLRIVAVLVGTTLLVSLRMLDIRWVLEDLLGTDVVTWQGQGGRVCDSLHRFGFDAVDKAQGNQTWR